MRQMIELEEAQQLLLENLAFHRETEEIAILNSRNRILAEDIYSDINIPPFNKSPLDGYCLRAADTTKASQENPVSLRVIEKIYAGAFPQSEIEEGTTAEIYTGAPIPRGADCIIRKEDIIRYRENILINKPQKEWDNYCNEGEDFKKGVLILEKGTVISSKEIGVFSSIGKGDVKAYKKPRIGIISTGDELTNIGEKLAPGKIYNSNLYMLASRIEELSCEPVILGNVTDDIDGIADSFRSGLKDVDLLITTGGVSVGEKDLVKEAERKMGAEILFWRVRVKPGTPALCSTVNKKLVISLSGNPTAASITFELLFRPLLAKLTGSTLHNLSKHKAIFMDKFSKQSKIRRILRGSCTFGDSGLLVNLSKDNQTPGKINSILNSNCLIDIPENSLPLSTGSVVKILI